MPVKLISFTAAGQDGVAVMRDDGSAIDLAPIGLTDMLALIRGGNDQLAVAADYAARPGTPVLAGYALRAPLPEPIRNIFCVGKNYRDHAREFGASGFDGGAKGGDEIPEAPIIFSKATTSVSAPGEPIRHAFDPHDSVDYEGELAVVIGTGGRAIARAAALGHVFGYTIVNDVTSREAQKRHKQWLLGKGIDGFCPMGPALVTANAIADVAALRLTTRVNGEIRQDASLADLIFDIPALIETISAFITLLPGDVIATGTPAGVGIGFSPPRYLKPGDSVSVTVDPIGSLSNPVV